MKRVLLSVIMCAFALLGNVNAQVTVEIGDDKNPSATSNYYLPAYDNVSYAVSQQIYTEEDFEDNLGAIHSVSFKLGNQRGAAVRQYEVYMKHTDLDVFEGAYVPITAADKVFDGSVNISGQKDSWYKITFDTPFDYAGGNVMLCVYDKTGVGLGTNGYHIYYKYAVDGNRAMYSQGPDPYDFNVLYSGSVLSYVNQVQFGMVGKPIVKVEPETINLGEAMLGDYWCETEPFEVSVKAVSTTITKIESDNAFFVVPDDIDYSSDLINFELTYDKNANVDGEVNGNLIVTYAAGVLEVPMTAMAYTPQTGDVWELAKEMEFKDFKYADEVKFAEFHDNYLLPRERVDGKANDVVYSFEFEEEKIIVATVKGTNANLSIYDETFGGNDGPSNNNNYKGSVAAAYEFFYDFNDGFLIDWVAKSYDSDDKSWTSTSSYGEQGKQYGKDNSYCIISYSHGYNGEAHIVDNVIMTENTYIITENSVLSLDATNYDGKEAGYDCDDHITVEVSKDGESYIVIEEIDPGQAQVYEHFTIDLGAKFEELGLEYSDYHIALRHKEEQKFFVCVDNIQLTNNARSKTRAAEVSIYAVPYPAGKYYAVAAAEGDFSFEMMLVNEDELPLAPTNVVATTIDEFTIELEWEEAVNATSYNIYRNDEFLVNVTETSYIDEDLTPNTDYCYIVKGYNDILESVPASKACAKTDKLVLDFPKSVSATAAGTTSIIVSWTRVEKAAGYYIYWGETIVGETADTTYTVEELLPDQEYCYNITSFNKDIESHEKSDFACAKTNALDPAVPSNVKAVATSEASIKLTWDAAENATSYSVYYNGELLKGNIRTKQYNIINLESGKEYCYTVSSSNGAVESEQCEPACATTLGDGVEELAYSFNIYPNPVGDKLYIETEMEMEEVVVYDVYGRVMISEQVNGSTNQQVVDASNMNAGVYFVMIKTNDGNVTKRFVKK